MFNRGNRPLRKRAMLADADRGILLKNQTGKKSVTLKYHFPIGDIIMSSVIPFIFSIAYYDIDFHVDTSFQHLWRFNEGVNLGRNPKSQIVTLNHNWIYENARDKKETICASMVRDFVNQTGLQDMLTFLPTMAKPFLQVNQLEIDCWLKHQNYILINPGYKWDKDLKWWGHKNWQELVDLLTQHYTVIQIGNSDKGFYNPRLRGVIDLVGQTQQIRQLMVYVKSAAITIGAESSLNHLSAALGVPSVVLGGGLEYPWRVTYNSTKYFDTIGKLDCCKVTACNNYRTHPVGDSEFFDKRICSLPVIEKVSNFHDGCYSVGKCMQLISPKEVYHWVINTV